MDERSRTVGPAPVVNGRHLEYEPDSLSIRIPLEAGPVPASDRDARVRAAIDRVNAERDPVRALLLTLSVAAIAGGGAGYSEAELAFPERLVRKETTSHGPPPSSDCPKCTRGRIRHGDGTSYCQRCGWFEVHRGA